MFHKDEANQQKQLKLSAAAENNSLTKSFTRIGLVFFLLLIEDYSPKHLLVLPLLYVNCETHKASEKPLNRSHEYHFSVTFSFITCFLTLR